MRFPTVLTRKFKYDANLLEYFVETEQTVSVRKRDLEAVRQAEAMADTEMPDASAVADKELMALPAAGPAGPAAEGTAPHPPLGSLLAEAKENLDRFVESLHKKASQATAWINHLEGLGGEHTDRQKQLLVPTCFF